MFKWFGLAFILALTVLFFAYKPLFAQAVADPDTLAIDDIFAYDSALEANDLLIVVVYDISYSSLPSLGANQTYICRFIADGTEQNAAEIVPFNDLGYGTGVCSFYWTAAQKTASSIEYNNTSNETYEVVVQGKPTAFVSPPTISNQNIQWREAGNTENLLTADIVAIATDLETDAAWVANNITLLDFVTGQTVFTTDGESYFGRAVPNLAAMIPDLFGSSVTKPFVDEREFTFSERERLNNFWSGTAFEDSMAAGADLFDVNQSYFAAFIGLFFVAFIAGLGIVVTGSPEFGIMTAAVTLPLMSVVGFLTLTFTVIVAGAAVLALGFALFLRRAS